VKKLETGELDELLLRINNNWSTLTFSKTAREDFISVVTDLPSYIASRVESLTESITTLIDSVRTQITAAQSITAPAGPAGPVGPQGNQGSAGDGAAVDLTPLFDALVRIETKIGEAKEALDDANALELTDIELAALNTLSANGTGLTNNYKDVVAYMVAIELRISAATTAVNSIESASGSSTTLDFLKEVMLDVIYSAGDIIHTTTSANPGTRMGGTWVPDGVGRVLVGAGGVKFIATAIGGASDVKLSSSESGLRAHTHTITHGANVWDTPSYVGCTNTDNRITPATLGPSTEGMYSGFPNAEATHENMPPYYVVYRWRRVS
jgi:hypothetical protein